MDRRKNVVMLIAGSALVIGILGSALYFGFSRTPEKEPPPLSNEDFDRRMEEISTKGDKILAEAQKLSPVVGELPPHLHYLRYATVRIKTGATEGSGIVVRQEGKRALILTIGYVVEGCRTLVLVRDQKGREKPMPRFDPTQVFFHTESGEECKSEAKILRYAGFEKPALLLAPCGKHVQPITWGDEGIRVVHVGALGGQLLTTVGRIPPRTEVDGLLYDQYPTMGTPGGGGGGIFLENGKCLGLLSRGGPSLTLALPTTAIRQWAKEKGVAWAIDPSIPVPSEAELNKIPIED